MLEKFFKLFYIFFKVGLFTVGGGYAMLPILEKEVVEKEQMVDHEEVLEAYSMAQTLPGVIASNTATLIGYRISGFFGAVASALGVIAPSIIIIMLVAIFFQKIAHFWWVESAFRGVRVAVLALLMDSFIRLFKIAVFDKKTLAIAVMSFVFVVGSWLNPILLIIAGALLGFAIYRERVGM